MMKAATHPEFNDQTEGLEVARAFSEEIRGKTIIVTGVNRQGIGYTTAEAFASQSPKLIVLAGRTPSKLQECIDTIKAQFPEVEYRALHIDLSSQQSARTAAAEVLSWSDVPAVDIIVNSAGIMMLPERTLSPEGIEMHFATNHIGHFLLSNLLMPKLLKAAQGSQKGAVRIINVTSLYPTTSKMRWSDQNFEKKTKDLPEMEQPSVAMLTAWGYKDIDEMSYIPLEGYNQSKVANVLYSIAATRRLFEKHGILSIAVHPGVIVTELKRDMSAETLTTIDQMVRDRYTAFKSLGAGSATSLVAALDPALAKGVHETHGSSENYGTYMIDCQISDKAHPLAVSSEEAEKLWQRSEELVKEKFAW